MIGIIPAAGKANRLENKCKTLIKVGGKPIIEYIIQNMLPLVNKIIIIQHGNEVQRAIGDDYLNIPIIYVQQKRRKGIAHAIYQCKREVKEDMIIILGDIIYTGSDLISMKKYFEENKLDFVFGVKSVEDKNLIIRSYGVLDERTKDTTIEDMKPMKVWEKPNQMMLENMLPVLGLGVYMATPKLFDYIRNTQPNERTGEIEFTDTINVVPFSKSDMKSLEGFYANVNTKEDLKRCEEFI